jgi:hypothetical protein
MYLEMWRGVERRRRRKRNQANEPGCRNGADKQNLVRIREVLGGSQMAEHNSAGLNSSMVQKVPLLVLRHGPCSALVKVDGDLSS